MATRTTARDEKIAAIREAIEARGLTFKAGDYHNGVGWRALVLVPPALLQYGGQRPPAPRECRVTARTYPAILAQFADELQYARWLWLQRDTILRDAAAEAKVPADDALQDHARHLAAAHKAEFWGDDPGPHFAAAIEARHRAEAARPAAMDSRDRRDRHTAARPTDAATAAAYLAAIEQVTR